MKQAALIALILLGLIVLGTTVKNEFGEQGPDESEAQTEELVIEQLESESANASTSESTPEIQWDEIDSAAVSRKFAIYKESLEDLDRRVALANQGPPLREHLVNMSREEQTEFAKESVRCASYFNIRSRMNDGFDDPEFDMRLSILGANFHDTSVSAAYVATGYSGEDPLDLMNAEKAVFRTELKELLAARNTPRLEQFKTAEEHRCLRLFDWMGDEG